MQFIQSCPIKEILGEVIVDHLRVRYTMVWLVQPPEGRLFFLGGQRTRNTMKGTHGTLTSRQILSCVSHYHFSPLNLVTITFQPRTHVRQKQGATDKYIPTSRINWSSSRKNITYCVTISWVLHPLIKTLLLVHGDILPILHPIKEHFGVQTNLDYYSPP